MTEIEQLRKEVNELRERLALIENTVRPIGPGVSIQPVYGHRYTPQPQGDPSKPPFVITCSTEDKVGAGTYSGTFVQPQPKADPGQVF